MISEQNEFSAEIFNQNKKKKKISETTTNLSNKEEVNCVVDKENKPLNQNIRNLEIALNMNVPEEFDLIPFSLKKTILDFDLKTINTIDSEEVPEFIYIESNLINPNLYNYYINSQKEFTTSIKKNTFKIICNCINGCFEDCVCARYNKQYLEKNPPYKVLKNKKNPKLIKKEIIQENIKPFTHIFECSEFCSCNKNLCNYQLLGWKNLKMVKESELIVKRYKKTFKNSDDNIIMWGLMTNIKIPKNTLVIEYIGEIISKGEADLRGNYYDTIGKNYLFDLTMAVEYKGQTKSGALFCIDNYMRYRKIEEKNNLLKDFPLCIDGFYYGNLSRFINHSCDPNLQVLSIHVENREILLPRVVLFSTREIQAGEELTFDYNCYPLSSDKELRCACSEPSCRGFIYN